MINRQNYLAMIEYLEYRHAVYMDAHSTNRQVRISLRHFLKWLDETEFTSAEIKRPSFPDYLTKQKNKAGGLLSPVHCEKALHHAKVFLSWHNTRGHRTKAEYIDTLRLPARFSTSSRLIEHAYLSEADMAKIAGVYWQARKENNIAVMRDAFAGVFLYLSGMRAGAFVTLPLGCFDIKNGVILQLPERGVLTKSGKAAKTFLLPIPELKKVIVDWLAYLHDLSVSDLLPIYPRLSVLSNDVDVTDRQKVYGRSAGRYQSLRRGMVEICTLAKIKPLSPHKFRHGHGVWGVIHAKDIKQLKAISQNMMHANLGITDGIYGKLRDKDVQDTLSDMG